MKESSKGVAALFFAYVIWGLHPIYWKMLQHISSMEILMQRILWAVPFAAFLVALQKRPQGLTAELKRNKKEILWLAAAGYVLAFNWYLFIWAVNNGQILSVSLAYFINPLLNMLFGCLFFGERMRGLQKTAIAIAVFGVAVQCWQAGTIPFVSLAIALTFAVYGVIKKKVSVAPEVGVLVEMSAVAPVALVFLLAAQRSGAAAYPYDMATNFLLAGAAIVSSVPLLFFSFGARRVPLATVGFVQFLSPSITFLIGTAMYGEPLDRARLFTFAIIWLALLLYTWDAFRPSGKGGKSAPRKA